MNLRSPNNRTTAEAGIQLLLHVGRFRARASEWGCYMMALL